MSFKQSLDLLAYTEMGIKAGAWKIYEVYFKAEHAMLSSVEYQHKSKVRPANLVLQRHTLHGREDVQTSRKRAS